MEEIHGRARHEITLMTSETYHRVFIISLVLQGIKDQSDCVVELVEAGVIVELFVGKGWFSLRGQPAGFTTGTGLLCGLWCDKWNVAVVKTDLGCLSQKMKYVIARIHQDIIQSKRKANMRQKQKQHECSQYVCVKKINIVVLSVKANKSCKPWSWNTQIATYCTKQNIFFIRLPPTKPSRIY